MLRKMSITALFLLLSSSTWANGFYVGAGFGPETANFDQVARINTPFFSNVKDTTQLSGTGVFGSLFGGYGWSRQAFYLAAEANANISSVKFKSTNSEYIHNAFAHTKYKMLQSYGLSLLPGYLFTAATLFYTRLGYANGHFRVATSDTSLKNFDKNLDGFRFGFGVKESFTEHLAGRMEYSHIYYQQARLDVIDGATTKTTKISPDTSQVEFSLIYEFC